MIIKFISRNNSEITGNILPDRDQILFHTKQRVELGTLGLCSQLFHYILMLKLTHPIFQCQWVSAVIIRP